MLGGGCHTLLDTSPSARALGAVRIGSEAPGRQYRRLTVPGWDPIETIGVGGDASGRVTVRLILYFQPNPDCMPSRDTQESVSADLLWSLLDLWVVVLLVALTGVLAFYLGPGFLPTATLLSVLLFMFLLPGYAVISALQPRRPREGQSGGRGQDGATISPEGGMAMPERLVLAAGVSVGVATTTGFTLHATGVGIQPGPASVVLTATTLTGCVVAAVRRLRLDADSRFDGRAVLSALAPVRGLFVRRSTVDLAITSLIVVSVLVAVASATFIAVSADGGESYTELYVLSPNGTGEPVAAAYPADENGSGELLVEVTNREGEAMNYTLVVQRQRVDGDVVAQSQVRDRFRIDLPPDGVWSTEYRVPTAGDLAGSRLVFLLYVDAPPDDPGQESAYRAVHVWLGTPESAAEESALRRLAVRN